MRNDLKIYIDDFGELKHGNAQNETVKQITFQISSGMVVQIITYGAAVRSIQIPNKHGQMFDVLLGFDTLDQYINDKRLKLGCVTDFCKSTETGENQNGLLGCSNWQYYLHDNTVSLTLLTGNILVTCSYQIREDNSIYQTIEATATLPMVINLGTNLYFNLAGHESTNTSVYDHEFFMNAEKCLQKSKTKRIEWPFVHVGGTAYDLRIPHKMRSFLRQMDGYELDDCFVLSKDSSDKSLPFVCELTDKSTGISLEILSNGNILKLDTFNIAPLDPNSIPFDEYDAVGNDANRAKFRSDITIAPEICSLDTSMLSESSLSSIECDECQNLFVLNENINKLQTSSPRQSVASRESASTISTVGCDECKSVKSENNLIGKNGVKYKRHGAVGLTVLILPIHGEYSTSNELTTSSYYFKHNILYKFEIDE